MSTVSLPIDAGVQVGPYLIERRLGQARVSTLYVARDSSGTRVALRLVQPGVATSAARVRLKREARALASIDHPGVVRLHGVGEHEGMPWIAMGYVRGTPLDRLIAEHGPLSIHLALRYAVQATDALATAHDIGVVHRELAPDKLLLTPEGRIVVVDFAIAPRGDETDVVDAFANTSPYSAPEQIEHGLADERSDVWGVGCVLYELVVGSPPFGEGGAATAAAVLRDEPLFPAHMPPNIAHIVSACMRKNSFARIASARELLVLLRDALGDPASEPVAPLGDRASTRLSSFPGIPASGTIPPPPRVPSMTFSTQTRLPVGTSSPPASATRLAKPRGRIKGSAVRAGICWFGDMYGDPGLARVMELASPELRRILRHKSTAFGLIASGWYDTQLIGELIELIERVASPLDPMAFGSSVGEAIARENVRGGHRALFRLVASPAMLEANAQRVWRTYVDEGNLSVRVRGKGVFEARVRSWSRHHPTVCRTLRAMLESSLRTVGYAGLTLERTHCVALGDTQCAFGGTWAP